MEVAFGANIDTDVELLKRGGVHRHVCDRPGAAPIPFWPMAFKNVRVFFLGSDDFIPEEKRSAAEDLNRSLEAGWSGFEIAERVPLEDIALAHQLVEHPRSPGRVVVIV